MKYRVTATITEELVAENEEEAIEGMADFLRTDTKPADFNYEVEVIPEGGKQ